MKTSAVMCSAILLAVMLSFSVNPLFADQMDTMKKETMEDTGMKKESQPVSMQDSSMKIDDMQSGKETMEKDGMKAMSEEKGMQMAPDDMKKEHMQ